jgi:hypothetical protein
MTEAKSRAKGNRQMCLRFIFFRMSVISLAILLAVPVDFAFAAPAVPAENSYDIPLSELNTVKKKPPVKRTSQKLNKKKSTDEIKPRETSVETAATLETAVQASPSPVEEKRAVQIEPSPQKPVVAAKPVPEASTIKIFHTPYSFVVTGKRTVIHAVIYSPIDVKEINCVLTAPSGAAEVLEKMVLVAGTQFTYSATLPAPAPDNPSLRYAIVAVDSSGKETRSREFVTPVSFSPIVPDWQIENGDGSVPVKRDAEK